MQKMSAKCECMTADIFIILVLSAALVEAGLLLKPQSFQKIHSGFGFILHCMTNVTNVPVAWSCYGLCSAHRTTVRISDSNVVDIAYRNRVSLIRLKAGQFDLLFTNASVSDSGTYICTDEQGRGKSAEGVVEVITGSESDGPTRRPSKFGTDVDDTRRQFIVTSDVHAQTSFECKTAAPETVKWFVADFNESNTTLIADGLQLKPNFTSKFYLQVRLGDDYGRSELTIRNASLSDSGIYTCRPANNTETAFALRVQGGATTLRYIMITELEIATSYSGIGLAFGLVAALLVLVAVVSFVYKFVKKRNEFNEPAEELPEYNAAVEMYDIIEEELTGYAEVIEETQAEQSTCARTNVEVETVEYDEVGVLGEETSPKTVTCAHSASAYANVKRHRQPAGNLHALETETSPKFSDNNARLYSPYHGLDAQTREKPRPPPEYAAIKFGRIPHRLRRQSRH